MSGGEPALNVKIGASQVPRVVIATPTWLMSLKYVDDPSEARHAELGLAQ